MLTNLILGTSLVLGLDHWLVWTSLPAPLQSQTGGIVIKEQLVAKSLTSGVVCLVAAAAAAAAAAASCLRML